MRISLILFASYSTAQYANSICLSDDDCNSRQICDGGTCRKRLRCDGVTCGANERCKEKTGECVCETGFALNSKGKCKSNPCQSTNCHQAATCSLNELKNGSFDPVCTCKNGKRGDGVNICVRDYCGTDFHRCGANTECKQLGESYNYDYECFCLPGYTGTGSRHDDLAGSGYRSDCEAFECEEKLVAPYDEKYEIVQPNGDEGFSWAAAQQLCREKGAYWDLVVIDSEQEHDHVMSLTNCATNGFWVGIHKDFHGADFETVLDEPADFLGKWKSGEPSGSEKELCVRMRLGLFNDGNCRSTYTNKKSSGIGMGYICEKHAKRAGPGLKCEQPDNDRLAPFKTAFGCPAPQCLGKGNYKIVDSWKKPANGGGLANLYGFAVAITLGNNAMDDDGGSVLLRFADGNRMGNIQTYNLRFWGFYNDNNDVLFHTKYWNTDRDDRKTVLITVDNISSPDYPEFFYWPSRVTKHNCFQNGNSRSGATRRPIVMDEAISVFKPELSSAECVRRVVFKAGEVRRINC